MIYIVKINDKEYEVEVEMGTANITRVTTVSEAPVLLPTPVSQIPIPFHTPAVVKAEGETVNAPMPGTILGIKVKPGMNVKKGELLVILEAMKMENEIVSPFDGIVKQICVGKGTSVSTGDPLVVIG